MPPQRRRLDAELVRRKIARSREQAREMIKSGRVTVGGFKAHKPASIVEPEVSIKVEEAEQVGFTWRSQAFGRLGGVRRRHERPHPRCRRFYRWLYGRVP